MPIHIGVMCDRCRKVHFIGTSSAILPGKSGTGMYRISCPAPCSEVREFGKDAMRPYRVSEEVFQRGYAEVDGYELVTVLKPQTTKPPKSA